ncbi:DEAD/DEAH box helicase [Methanolobus bombayensis]|uniref:DEAD/DEAH box helicase n=1 Tax=Methanolobus bombayensis TaxID=38023 RepID=UPI001AE4DDF6|nr:DEAD/DEAH box helicase [Methanolobus bombayensis]MBP1908574.1 superfamily II DNA or RNA helicase [Methanolobus bombayensis]
MMFPHEKEWMRNYDNLSFEYFNEKKLIGIPIASALGVADAELLSYYDHKYDPENNRFVLQLDFYDPSNYKKLENFVAEASLNVVGEKINTQLSVNFNNDFSAFRKSVISTLRPFSLTHQLNLLKKISMDCIKETSIIDDCYRVSSIGSSVFAIELFIKLIACDELDNFSNNLYAPQEYLADLSTKPKLMLKPWPHQAEALDKWLVNGGKGILEMATASGKTLVGLAIAERLFNTHGKLNVLVLAHSKAILNQWRAEAIEKLGLIADKNLDYDWDLAFKNKFRIQFNTLQTVYKNPDLYPTDLLIVDEVHHGAGKEYRNALTVPSKWKLGLSATVEGGERERILDKYLGKTVYEFTLKDARERGIIPEFKLYIHKTFLDIAEEREFDNITEKIKNVLNYINATYSVKIRELSNGKYTQFDSISDFVQIMEKARYGGRDVPEEWNKLTGLIFQRRKIIHQSSPKIESGIQLALNEGKNKKCVIFSMDIETCERIYGALASDLNAYRIHSGLKEKEVKYELEMFKKCKSGVLIAPRMLDEGINIPDAEIGINISSAKTKLQLVQRMGRVLRKGPDKKPVFHHFVALPRSVSFINSEDSFSYLSDLAWVQEVTSKMGISAELYDKSNAEINELELISEKIIYDYYSKHSEITTSDFGTIKASNIIKSLDESSGKGEFSPRQILIHLLKDENEYISDARWLELLRIAHGNDSMVNIPGHHWLLLISGRDPDKLKSILEARRIT